MSNRSDMVQARCLPDSNTSSSTFHSRRDAGEVDRVRLGEGKLVRARRVDDDRSPRWYRLNGHGELWRIRHVHAMRDRSGRVLLLNQIADVQKELNEELLRLRAELKVPPEEGSLE